MAERKSFGQLRNVLEMPDLIGLQVDSYDNFLQRFVPPAERKRQGLQEIFIAGFRVTGTGTHNGSGGYVAPKTSSTRKYVCPCCGMSVRATKVVRVQCMDCEEALVLVG